MTSFEVWDNEDKCISDMTSSQDNSKIFNLNIEQAVLHDKNNGWCSRNLIPRVYLLKNPLLSNILNNFFLEKSHGIDRKTCSFLTLSFDENRI